MRQYTQSFTNASGGQWRSRDNWSGGRDVKDGDILLIDKPVTVTVAGWSDWYAGIAIDTAAGSNLVVQSGLRFTGNSTIQGTLTLQSAFIVADGQITIASLTMQLSDGNKTGSRLIGAGSQTVTGVFDWSAGALVGSGNTSVARGARLDIHDGDVYLGRTLDLHGKGSLSNATLHLDYFDQFDTKKIFQGTLTIKAGASLALEEGAEISAGNSGPVAGKLVNAGTLTKSGSGTAGIYGIDFWNSGTLKITMGTLDISSTTLQNSGIVDVRGGASLVGNTATQFKNAGSVRISGHGVVNTNLSENSGKISVTGGELDLASDAANTGLIEVNDDAGVFALGKLIGGGTIDIRGDDSLVEINGASDNIVNFARTSDRSTLQLDESAKFTGMIRGFGGTSALDLADIIAGSARMSYQQGAASGVLTVTDGTHTARLTLAGLHQASDFRLSADKNGGTMVTHA